MKLSIVLLEFQDKSSSVIKTASKRNQVLNRIIQRFLLLMVFVGVPFISSSAQPDERDFQTVPANLGPQRWGVMNRESGPGSPLCLPLVYVFSHASLDNPITLAQVLQLVKRLGKNEDYVILNDPELGIKYYLTKGGISAPLMTKDDCDTINKSNGFYEAQKLWSESTKEAKRLGGNRFVLP